MTDERLNDAKKRYRLLRVALEHFGCDPSALTPEQHQQASRIIERQLQIEQAVLNSPEAAHIRVSDSHLDEALERIYGQYETPEDLQAALNGQSLDANQLRQALATELHVEHVLQHICSDLPEIAESAIQEYYHSNIDRFTRPPSRKTRHILVTINPDYPENTREAARTRIDAILHRLQAKPQNFEHQAAKYSECPTAMQGGLLGEVTPGKLYPELDSHLFTMDEGQISPVLESPLGFHLLFCENITPGGTAALDEVRPRLQEWLHSRQQQVRQREWLKALLLQQAGVEK